MGYYGILWDVTAIVGYYGILQILWNIMGYSGILQILWDIMRYYGYWGILWDITGYYGTSFPRFFIHSFSIIVSVLDVLISFALFRRLWLILDVTSARLATFILAKTILKVALSVGVLDRQTCVLLLMPL